MDINIESSWQSLLESEFSQPYFKSLMKFVDEQYENYPSSTFPPKKDVFRAFRMKRVEEIKVVIIGQDPYPTKGHANGLCFSLRPEVKPLAKSLLNIFKEIESDLGIPIPENGDLSRWADQGVLMLNSILTVHEGQPLSHQKKGWEQFTDAVVQKLIEERNGIVFILWGTNAVSKLKDLDIVNHSVLSSPHPSPLSSYRGFFGCKHFSKANNLLISKGETPILW